ncbi:MAG: type I-U CRISPR-associated protein Csb2 [Propionibacteriaceae bacterium]|nr:type I-U CRISPR-associated protein Csb2 [Propionibacteriaceae bacterium]
MAFRFIGGMYAATAWNSSANSGTVEWPPSPWRISRALLAVAHDKLPEQDLDTVRSVLSELASEHPTYLVPPAIPWHSRHYLPDLDHRSGETRRTTMTMNSMVSVRPDQPLHVTWPNVELDEGKTACLARCLGKLSYLGRAESLVEAVLEPPSADNHQELAPGAFGPRLTRLLCPTVDTTTEQWEITPDAMRKQGFLTPAGTEWVTYGAPAEEVRRVTPTRRSTVPEPTVVRWGWRSRAPLKARNAILVTERLRGRYLSKLQKVMNHEVPTTLTGHFPRSVDGQQLSRTGHGHAHWLWLADQHGVVTDLALWVPDGIPAAAFSALAEATSVRRAADGYAPKGFVEGSAQLVGVGQPDQILPELVASGGGASTWTSETPFLRTRHLKRSRDPWAVLKDDVRTEWTYRETSGTEIVAIEQADGTAREFRRYRWKESMADRRDGVNLRITFSAPVRGPLSLGALSHFGFGLFRPES